MIPFEMGTGRKFLVIARVGEESLHREWLEPTDARNFDLCLSYYGNIPGRYAQECEYYLEEKGPKWPKLHDLIERYGQRIFEYEAVWFPDDDISTDSANISRMFDMFAQHRLSLAQPALLKNAFFQVTARHIDYDIRFTRFVEVMVPLFSRDALKLLWPTFNSNTTGWGLEYVWAKLLGYPDRGIAILDAVPVKHTRPPGTGDLYRNIKSELGLEANAAEEMGLLRSYQIIVPHPDEITFHDGIKRWQPELSGMETSISKPAVRRKKRKQSRTGKKIKHPLKLKKKKSGAQKPRRAADSRKSKKQARGKNRRMLPARKKRHKEARK